MAKDAVATMGDLLPDDAGGRDAVHVAVFSAMADKKLHPGDDVGIVEQGEPDAKVSAKADPVGVVDPFLKKAGERFWVYLYPRTITALSHRWSHPAFEATTTVYAAPVQKLAAEQWLRNWISSTNCPGYEWFIGQAAMIADGHDQNGYDAEYMHVDGRDAHGDIPADVWPKVEIVLGRPIRGKKPSYFSCSC
jgi:hypothetical protein